MRVSRSLSAIALTLAMAFVAPSSNASAFVEITAQLLPRSTASGLVVGRIVRLRPLGAAFGMQAVNALTVACPSNELKYWKTELRVGDTLRFERIREGGLSIAVPLAGWPERCSCTGKSTPVVGHLFASFVTVKGATGRVLSVPSGSWIGRAATLGFGGKPKPPRTVVLRCGWDRSIGLGATESQSASVP